MYRRREATSCMVRQELAMSCGAACARQLLLDVSVDVPEAVIRDLAKFDPEFDAKFGIAADALAGALNKLHRGATYLHGGVAEEHLELLALRVPFIVLLSTPSSHFVIVDEVGAQFIRVRDPAGTAEQPLQGMAGVMDRSVFIERWSRAGWCVIFRDT